jgi:hypothetical protein
LATCIAKVDIKKAPHCAVGASIQQYSCQHYLIVR